MSLDYVRERVNIWLLPDKWNLYMYMWRVANHTLE